MKYRGLLISSVLAAVAAVVLLVGAALYAILPYDLRGSANLEKVKKTVEPVLSADLQKIGAELGDPIFVRIFKEPKELEIWIVADETYRLFKTYPICTFSGALGPKLKEGDNQSPEGFYSVSASQLNPHSTYHLSFNLGFPNRFDRAHGRTGSYLMVHGNCVSVGCYAMTDEAMEEIYLLAEAALNNGQLSFDVHAFPFRMTRDAMDANTDSRWIDFWENMKDGYDYFEKHGRPPGVGVRHGQYIFG